MNDDCHRLEQGDCLHVLKAMADDSIDLVYLDPPFLLQSLQVQADLNHLLTLHVNAYLDTLIEVYPHVKIETLKMVYKSNREEKTKHGLDLIHDADF